MEKHQGQLIWEGFPGLARLRGFLAGRGVRRPLLVCGSSYDQLPVKEVISGWGLDVVRFSGFSPNPKVAEAEAGLAEFARSGCDALIAVGGGSAIDVAKAVKAFQTMDGSRAYLGQAVGGSQIPLVAIPTTAGSGSESTSSAVIYSGGEKQSIAGAALLPDAAALVGELLASLPGYQRKSTLLDALCQCIESSWTPQATPESIEYSRRGISLVLANTDAYLAGDLPAALAMLRAANLSGKAVNITRTNAPHALSYRITTTYGIAHGHAVSLTLGNVWEYFLDHRLASPEPKLLDAALARLTQLFGAADDRAALSAFLAFRNGLGLATPKLRSEAELADIVASVNPQRLQNSPVPLDAAALATIVSNSLV